MNPCGDSYFSRQTLCIEFNHDELDFLQKEQNQEKERV